MKKLCVLGLGYIGLPTAAMFATSGFQVVGVDIDERVVNRLRQGEVHIQDPGLEILVQTALHAGNLQVSDQPECADAFIITVPTPFASLPDQLEVAHGRAGSHRPEADLSYVVRATEAIVPSWLEVDLVPLERVYPEVRSRILGERSMPEDPHLALKIRLEDELIGLERIARGVEMALERAGEAPDEFATRALASYVDDFYKSCEHLCERVAVTLDGSLPQGERWHQMLLGQMGEPGGEGCPPLFAGSLLLELDEYRRFRHRVRHIYGYEVETERVLALARGVASVLGRVKAAVTAFGQWLEGQAESSEQGQG